MIFKEYVLKLTQLSRYISTAVVDSRDTIGKFVLGVSEVMV